MLDLIVDLFALLQQAINWLLIALVIGVVALMLLRVLVLRVSPFGWPAYYIRRATDPMVWPVVQHMPGNQGAAPLILIIATLVGAFFFKWMVSDVLLSLRGLFAGLSAGAPLQVIGWLLYGAVAVLLVLIVARIVMSWVPFMRDGWLMWTLYRFTEPVMAPFRQLIPPLGMFDLSPIVLIFLLQFAQDAIRSVFGLILLR